MSSNLHEALQRLKNRGEMALASEVESLLEVTTDRIPFSRRFLAQAAHEIRAGQIPAGHDFVGAALEAHHSETQKKDILVPKDVEAKLVAANDAPECSFLIPLPDLPTEHVPFGQADDGMVCAFAKTLMSGGYEAEAQAYLSEHVRQKSTEGEDDMRSDRKTLEKLEAKFQAEGNGAMAKAVKKILADLDEKPEGEEAEADDFLAKEKDDEFPPAPATSEKDEEDLPMLPVEPASEAEVQARRMATAAIARGNAKRARKFLAEARRLERRRLIAGLIEAGDMDLAMEGIAEEEQEQKQAGYEAPAPEAVEPVEEPEAADKLPEPAQQEVATDKPAAPPAPPAEPKAEEKPNETPVGQEPEKKDEEIAASRLVASVRKHVAAKRFAEAKKAIAKLVKLEAMVTEGVRKAESGKKMALAAEGFSLWAKVRKAHLTAKKILAEGEDDMEAKQEAMEAMERLDDALDTGDEGQESQSAELTQDFVTPPGGVQEAPVGQPAAPVAPAADDDLSDLDLDLGDEEEGSEDHEASETDEEKECEEKCHEDGEEEEADAMKYEVLQSIEALKGMKVDRNGLAFTFWSDANQESPYWTIQANGKPIAEVHLKDQPDHNTMRTFFCDEAKYPQALAQSVQNAGLYDMLKGVKARFYAHEVEKTALAQKMKQEAIASVADVRAEKLADLRTDFVDAVNVAAEALNKGLMKKPNTLKAAFVKTLAQYGIHNPALIVEASFAEGFDGFMAQVLADAQEYMEMPKEAFSHAKKMVLESQNVAHAAASNYSEGTLAQRLARNSMPLGSVPAAQEAPVVQEQIEAMARHSDSDVRKQTRQRLRLSDRF